MKIVTLLENTACTEAFRAAHGLSLYIETPHHRILFDAGPNPDFAVNAERLGVDLSAVDVAVLSHGHSDHGGGQRTFFKQNPRARGYFRPTAWEEYYAAADYIGLDPALRAFRHRFVAVEGTYAIDQELTLFTAAGDFPAMDTSARLKRKNPAGELVADTFGHEQDLLICAEGKAVLVAGCAHRGIVNIQRGAVAILGRSPDAVVGGFHLFQLNPADPASDQLLRQIGEALAPGSTVYYTGHCTGDYPFRTLRAVLGDRLRAISSGMTAEI